MLLTVDHRAWNCNSCPGACSIAPCIQRQGVSRGSSVARCCSFRTVPSGQAPSLPRLRVSDNKRFLVTADGRPFFWLGDTAWELFHRLTREDADRYLQNRSKLGFTVIQAVALAEFDGLGQPNPYGHTPLANNDPTQPNDAYFGHVDWIVKRANALGLYVGLLPTWGDKWNRAKFGVGPEIFTPANAETYGRGSDSAIVTRESSGSSAATVRSTTTLIARSSAGSRAGFVPATRART